MDTIEVAGELLHAPAQARAVEHPAGTFEGGPEGADGVEAVAAASAVHAVPEPLHRFEVITALMDANDFIEMSGIMSYPLAC